jgi:hypothetical protein
MVSESASITVVSDVASGRTESPQAVPPWIRSSSTSNCTVSAASRQSTLVAFASPSACTQTSLRRSSRKPMSRPVR